MSFLWSFLKLNWKPIGIALLALSAWLALRHYGDGCYRQGRADEFAVWTPRLAAAEKAASDANAKTATIDAASKAAVAEQEARHADELKVIDSRTADYQRRYSALLLRFRALDSSRSQVPPVPGSTSDPSQPSGSDERIERAAGLIADTGRRCERDSKRLAGWIDWYQRETALRAR